MEEKNKDEDWLRDLPVTAEKIGFQAEEMLNCETCGRSIPPNRARCLYCGAAVRLTVEQAANVRPSSRKLEPWETGWNVVIGRAAGINEAATIGLARLLGISEEELNAIASSPAPLPIARYETEVEARSIQQRLSELGAVTVSDKELVLSGPPPRLRGIEFDDQEATLLLFNNDEIARVNREDICLLVLGRLVKREVATSEMRKRDAEKQIKDSAESAEDESVIDLYSRSDAVGWRIHATGFDFSCLGAEKKMLAVENMLALINKLRQFFSGAKFDEDYLQCRAALARVWPLEEAADAKGVQRGGVGKYAVNMVTTTNNRLQLDKYSRLQKVLQNR